MHPLSALLKNPLTEQGNQRDREELIELFPALSLCPDRQFLALRGCLRNCPERFFDVMAYSFYLEWLQDRHRRNSTGLRAYLDEHAAEIDKALLFNRETNLEMWHDELPMERDEYSLVRIVDKYVHPAYLRLVEAVLIPLVRCVAYFSRIDRGKRPESLDVWPTVEELSRSQASVLVAPYSQLVRNAIAHGGITYLQHRIRYHDKKGNEETYDISSIVRLCDDLLDTCNGIAAGLRVFFAVNREHGYRVPKQMLLEELQEETRSPWWEIDGCIPTEIASKTQLIVYAHPKSRDYAKITMATIQSGILAEYFARGYDRYFFSLRSKKALPGWAGFDGRKLAELRAARISEISQYQGVVENDLVFYVLRPALPRFMGKIDTLVQSLRIVWPAAMEKYRQERGIPEIICRNATVHRNAWGAVLNADVVIHQLANEGAPDVLRRWKRRIVKTALKSACRTIGIHRIVRHCPLGFARVAVFRKDYRCRRLASFGLGADLVCILQFQRLRRIKSPDIIGSTIETLGKWRIAWNRAWLEEFKVNSKC